MEKITTLNHLLASEKNEEFPITMEGPSDATLQFILNYSKALEVQEGKILNDYPTVLN